MEEERVLLKQQKVQLNLLCAWNLIHEYQDPLGNCYFTQLKVDMWTLEAFQRNMYTGCPYMQPQQLFFYQVYIWIRVPCVHLLTWWGCMHGERCHCVVRTCACLLCRHTTHTRGIFSVCLFSFHKLFSFVWGTKPVVERFGESALLCRRKRYFNSAVNKFCPFTCVRNTLNKLRFQDLAPRHQPNKSRRTALGEGRGSGGNAFCTR